MNHRRKLSDILRGDTNPEHLSSLWKATAAAEERGPLPPGEFTFRILSGELFNAKLHSTPGYKLTLEVTEGEFEGRRTWVDLWLTPAALPMTKRDLGKIGVTDLEQLEKPLPQGILIRGKLAMRRDNDGNERNRLLHFECIGIEPGDVFEPKDDEADSNPDQGGIKPGTGLPLGANVPTGGNTAPAPSSNGEPPAGSNGTPPKPKRKKKGASTQKPAEGGTHQ